LSGIIVFATDELYEQQTSTSKPEPWCSGQHATLSLWRSRVQIPSVPLSPIFGLSVTPLEETDQPSFLPSSLLISPPRKQRRPGPDTPRHALPRDQWPEVVSHVEQGESLRQVAARFDVSHETIRRIYLKHEQQQKGGE
jgi:hypothetical protein